MKKILVVTQNSGGSEVLSSLVRFEERNFRWFVIAPQNSPAFQIFQKKGLYDFIQQTDCVDWIPYWLEQIEPNFVFCGTGWSDINFEHRFIKEAKKRFITTVSFLDHWVNYRERFGYPAQNWKCNLPDYIAVGDIKAFRIAHRLKLPNLIKLKNYYLADMINEYNALDSDCSGNSNTLLIFSTPISEYTMKQFGQSFQYSFTEHQLIKDILRNFQIIAKYYKLKKIVIRLHPAEDKHKYDYLLKDFSYLKLNIENPYLVNLIISLKNARLVVGFESMPLFISYLIRKPFISYMPRVKTKQYDIPLPEECRVGNILGFTQVNFKNIKSSRKKILFDEHHNLSFLLASIEKKGG